MSGSGDCFVLWIELSLSFSTRWPRTSLLNLKTKTATQAWLISCWILRSSRRASAPPKSSSAKLISRSTNERYASVAPKHVGHLVSLGGPPPIKPPTPVKVYGVLGVLIWLTTLYLYCYRCRCQVQNIYKKLEKWELSGVPKLEKYKKSSKKYKKIK